MAIKITEECINCGACESECPNYAIYEGGKKWRMSDGTSLKNNKNIFFDPLKYHDPLNLNTYFIVPDKCTECIGFFDEPQCISVCPVNCCVLDENNIENKKSLLKKKNFLHEKYL